ncbi:MAG: hypothetical protein QXU40_00360 [Candidatus Pacearchaeota archaeon]
MGVEFNRIFKINTIASEKLFSLWWFLILGVVGVAIVGGVFIFYSGDIDIRETESLVLYNKLMDCITDNGYLNRNLIEENFDILKECNLNRVVLSSGIFYLRVKIYDGENRSLLKEIREGTFSFDKDCSIAVNKKIRTEKFPKCVEKEEKALYYDGKKKKEVKINILTASNQ